MHSSRRTHILHPGPLQCVFRVSPARCLRTQRCSSELVPRFLTSSPALLPSVLCCPSELFLGRRKGYSDYKSRVWFLPCRARAFTVCCLTGSGGRRGGVFAWMMGVLPFLCLSPSFWGRMLVHFWSKLAAWCLLIRIILSTKCLSLFTIYLTGYW